MDEMEVDNAPSGTKRKAEEELEAQKPARRIRV
jgi:DNA mismatch repair protein MLH1